MPEVTSRYFFKNDWHCAHNHDCGCWKNIDIERDKKFLAWCFRDLYGKHAKVSYTEYKAKPEDGKLARDKNLYHVDVRSSLIPADRFDEAFWHGFTLQWIAATGKDKLSLAFEHNGVYVEKE